MKLTLYSTETRILTQVRKGPVRALRKFAGAMLKFFKRRSKVTFKVTCKHLRYSRKGNVMRNTHAKYES